MHVDNITPEEARMEMTPYEGRLPKSLEKYRSRIVDYEYPIGDGGIHQAYFIPGWRREDDLVHSAIGDTVKEVLETTKNAEPCWCANCEHYRRQAKKITF